MIDITNGRDDLGFIGTNRSQTGYPTEVDHDG